MSLSRATLPEEFYDFTSAQLLAQPEPQYAYALMFLRAMNINLSQSANLAMPGRDAMGNGGGYRDVAADRLELEADRLSSDLFAAKHNFRASPGHTIRFNRPLFADTTYTEDSRLVATGASISTEAIAVGSEQVPLTVKRYAGPYDSANTRVAPLAVEAFDATMGVHDMYDMAGVHFVRDFHKFLDSVWVTLADNGANVIWPDGISAANDMTSKDYPLTYEQISRASKKADKLSLPRMGDGKRLMVVTPDGKRQLKDDPQFAAYAKENRDTNPIFPGWFASLDDVHMLCSNTLTQSDNSSSVEVHTGHLIAPGAFLGGIGRPPRVAPSTDDNYGETVKAVWIADLAMGLADSSFILPVKHSEDAQD